MKWGAWSVVFTGLSLTSITAVVLFVLVAINPKDAVYGSTPLVYAAGSAISADRPSSKALLEETPSGG